MTGMPEVLWPRVAEWTKLSMEGLFGHRYDLATAYALKMGVYVQSGATTYSVIAGFLRKMEADEVFGWDVVDDLLRLGADSGHLRILLDLVDHELSVDPDNSGLISRVPEEVAEEYALVVAANDHAAKLLKSAWARTFSRYRNPKAAWEDATNAVENLLQPLVSPNDEKATLSKMAAALRDKPSKWRSHLRVTDGGNGVLALASALEIVWYTPARHGEEVAVDPLMSRAAVLQAITICQWLRDGVLESV